MMESRYKKLGSSIESDEIHLEDFNLSLKNIEREGDEALENPKQEHTVVFHTKHQKIYYYALCTFIYFGLYGLFVIFANQEGLSKHPTNQVVIAKSNVEQFFESSSDVVISIAYFVIPIIIVYIAVKRKDVPFNGLFWMFGSFIICCGLTHVFTVCNLWAKYTILGPISKFITALVSFVTAVQMVNLIPLFLHFPSPEQLRQEISERKIAEKKLQAQYEKIVLIREITLNIRKSHKIKDIFETTVNQLGMFLNLSRCTILSFENLDDVSHFESEFCAQGIPSVKQIETSKISLKGSSFITNTLASHRACTMYRSSKELDGDVILKDFFKKMRLKSILCVRTTYQNNFNGLIILQHCNLDHVWTQEEIEILESVVAQVAVGLTHAHLIELDKAREIAEKGSKAKSDFLAMVSHEVRTPMNAILGMVNILQNSTPNLGKDSNTSEAECVRIIMDSSTSLLGLLNTILDFSKIESGTFDVEESVVNLKKCINKIFLLARAMIHGSDIVLEMTYAPDVPDLIITDKLRLRQILVNLLSNAIKFTSKGKVSLHIKVVNDYTVDNLKLQFDVSDTGIGIPQNRLHCLFKAFSQVDHSTTRKYGGIGLGLVISKELCKAMGGEMWVNSKENVGTVFSFTLIAGIAPENPVLTQSQLLEESESNYTSGEDEDGLTSGGDSVGNTSLSNSIESSPIMSDINNNSNNNIVSSGSYSSFSNNMKTINQSSLNRSNDSSNNYNNNILLNINDLNNDGKSEILSNSTGDSATHTKPLRQPLSHHNRSQSQSVMMHTSTQQQLQQPQQQQNLNSSHSFTRSHSQNALGLNLSLSSSPPSTMKRPLSLKSSTSPPTMKRLLHSPSTTYKKTKRILIAEDNKVNQKVVTKILEQGGFKRVDVVEDGNQAFDAIVSARDDDPYHVVLMDLHMTNCDGITATKRIRSFMGKKYEPYIIALTADIQIPVRRKCLEIGMNQFIGKPFKPKELYEIILCGIKIQEDVISFQENNGGFF